jgi:hypothetical protein
MRSMLLFLHPSGLTLLWFVFVVILGVAFAPIVRMLVIGALGIPLVFGLASGTSATVRHVIFALVVGATIFAVAMALLTRSSRS